MSTKRSDASRTNGAKGKGPTSPDSKNRSRMNARKLGLFARELVITEIGERWEDFTAVREWFRASFRPVDQVEEMLCEDAAYNWWRRQRVRRCEAAEIRKVIRSAEFLAAVDLDSEASILKEKFSRLVMERLRATPSEMLRGNVRGPAEVNADLVAVCCELRQSFPGLDFLIETLEAVAVEADAKGELSATSEVLLYACLGANDSSVTLYVNALIKKRVNDKSGQVVAPGDPSEQRPAEEKRADTENTNAARPLSAEQAKKIDRVVLASLIRIHKAPLECVRDVLRAKQEAEGVDHHTRVGAVLTSSQLNRAEAAYDCRFYKILKTFYSIRFQQAQLELARESSKQLAQGAHLPKSQ